MFFRHCSYPNPSVCGLFYDTIIRHVHVFFKQQFVALEKKRQIFSVKIAMHKIKYEKCGYTVTEYKDGTYPDKTIGKSYTFEKDL